MRAVLARSPGVQPADRIQVPEVEGPRCGPIVVAVGRRAGPCQADVPAHHLETQALVDRPAHVRGDQADGSTRGLFKPFQGCLGQRAPEPGTALVLRYEDQPDPACEAVARRDDRARDGAPDLGDHRLALGMPHGEVEKRTAIAPLPTKQGFRRRSDVALGHRADGGGHGRHRPIVRDHAPQLVRGTPSAIIGRWPPCRGTTSPTSPIWPAWA